MIIHDLDLGSHSPYRMPSVGIRTAQLDVPGSLIAIFPVAGDVPSWQARVWINPPAAIGGAAVGSKLAVQYLGRQLEELSRNLDLQPTYVQFFAGTGLSGPGPVPQDGWFFIKNVKVDYSYELQGFAPADMTFEYATPGLARRTGIWSAGASLATAYTGVGGATNWHAYPVGSTNLLGSLTRTGAEGAIPWVVSPALNPSPTVLSSTIANYFQGGCRVYDANAAIGTNPVPSNKLSVNQASLETSTAGWTAGTNTTIAQSAAQALYGSNSLSLTGTGSGDIQAFTPVGTGGFGITPSVQYTALASFRTAATPRTVAVDIFYYQASGSASAVRSSDTQTAGPDTTSGWTQVIGTFTSPSDAVYAAVQVRAVGAINTEVHYVDGISLAPGNSSVWLLPGLVTNPAWVEVKGIDHRFVGDIIFTNGLHLYTFTPGSSPGISLYLWNTSLGTPAWQKFADLYYEDNNSVVATVRQITLRRVGLNEIAAEVVESTSGNNLASLTFRLQPGAYTGRLDFRPLTQSNTNNYSLFLGLPSGPKIAYNSGNVVDVPIQASSLSATTDYGYSSTFINLTPYPLLVGWLHQTAPAFQPAISSPFVSVGDSLTPSQGTTSSYGFFATPFGTSADNTNRLQAEAESGTLSGGVVTNANGSASNGSEAKVPSGTGGQIPAPNPLSGMTDTGAGAGTLNKGGYQLVQTWTDASGETISSGDNTSNLTVALVQKTATVIATPSSTTIVPTLPAGSTAGNCLIAVVSNRDGLTYTAPAGWTRLASINATDEMEIWAYLNNPGGITSATFTASGTQTNARGHMSEWSNVALVSALDASGINGSNSGTTLGVTSSLFAANGDVVIGAWQQYTSVTGTVTFTTPANYTRLIDNGGTSDTRHTDIEYRLNPSSGRELTTFTSSTTTVDAVGINVVLRAAPTNVVFLTTNGDKLHVPLITGAPATTTNGKFYFTAAVSPMNAGLAATQAVAGSQIAAFDIIANPGSAVSPPATNTTAGTPGVDLFGTSWIPPVGTYDLWMRIKVTSAAGAINEMKFGLWDVTSSAYVSSTILKPNQVTTSYVWYRVAASVVPTAGHNMQYRLNTNAGTGTDWFIDEAALVPLKSTTFYSWPQDLWQQFIYDRTTKLILD